MAAETRDRWFRGGGSLYRPAEEAEASGQGLRLVLGGRTWVVQPEAD